ncbi:hypothetical protein GF382_00580 [Candidatus Falkowbacteria bacterium]|nr:hypothetical protein [Candidatus Falkowbacteria bacterium]
MLKKIFVSFLALSMSLTSAILPIGAASADQVCGMDNITYTSAEAAEEAGVDVSYDFACVDPASEDGLYEAKSDVNFAGMLIEIGTTELPTTIIVRRNSDQKDFTVEVDADTTLGQNRSQATELSDWIPGDQIRVRGQLNENKDTVEASMLANASMSLSLNRGINGWITAIDKEAKSITYQWMNREYDFSYDDNTKFVAGVKNPASVDDLEVNDRIRGRLLDTTGDDLAKIVVVLRRGSSLFMKLRTFRPNATLVRMDSTIVPTTIQVRVDDTPGLRANDVNNLVGTEGTLVTVNITEDTKIVRKYFGECKLDEFSIGDSLHIVGRANDDGTVDAKVLKNNSIWMTSTMGVAGEVKSIDLDENTFTMDWTPIKYATKKALSAVLEAEDSEVSAQAVANRALTANRTISGSGGMSQLRDALKARIKNIVSEAKDTIESAVGQFKRMVQYKKVNISRISHDGIKIGDLIDRLPSREITVRVNDKTRIVVGKNTNATLADIKIGDKVRGTGVKHSSLPLVDARTVVVVSSLPEVEESEDIGLDDINEVVSEIVTEDDDSVLVSETETETEEIIEVDEDGNVADDQGAEETDEETESEETDENIDQETSTSTQEEVSS